MASRTFIVTARSDGRGGFRPFGSYSSSAAGGKVNIGEKTYQIGRDGRVNIPKSIMEQYGRIGRDGRTRVSITFSSASGIDGWRDLSAIVSNPVETYADAQTGDVVSEYDYQAPRLLPYDVDDRSWSP